MIFSTTVVDAKQKNPEQEWSRDIDFIDLEKIIIAMVIQRDHQSLLDIAEQYPEQKEKVFELLMIYWKNKSLSFVDSTTHLHALFKAVVFNTDLFIQDLLDKRPDIATHSNCLDLLKHCTTDSGERFLEVLKYRKRTHDEKQDIFNGLCREYFLQLAIKNKEDLLMDFLYYLYEDNPLYDENNTLLSTGVEKGMKRVVSFMLKNTPEVPLSLLTEAMGRYSPKNSESKTIAREIYDHASMEIKQQAKKAVADTSFGFRLIKEWIAQDRLREKMTKEFQATNSAPRAKM